MHISQRLKLISGIAACRFEIQSRAPIKFTDFSWNGGVGEPRREGESSTQHDWEGRLVAKPCPKCRQKQGVALEERRRISGEEGPGDQYHTPPTNCL